MYLCWFLGMARRLGAFISVLFVLKPFLAGMKERKKASQEFLRYGVYDQSCGGRERENAYLRKGSGREMERQGE